MTLTQVHELARRVLERHGLAAPHVEAVAQTMVLGERDACRSHGIYRLPGCVHTMKAGKVALDALPVLEDVAGGLVRVDARGGFAPLAFETGRGLLASKARSKGIAALAINDCVHFAALWPEVESLAEDGLVSFAFTPSHAWVAPAGGSRPLLGTNPLAFGWPRRGSRPFVFDFATSVAARGEIELHHREGRAIPQGWGIDRQGQPTTDAAEAMKGAMLTFGGHKGSALAMMIELIAGPLIGDLTSRESLAADGGANAAPLGGELIIAIDPERFLGESAQEHLTRAERLFDGVLEQGARLPSQRRYEARERSLAHGVQVPRSLLREIETLLA